MDCIAGEWAKAGFPIQRVSRSLVQSDLTPLPLLAAEYQKRSGQRQIPAGLLEFTESAEARSSFGHQLPEK
jgi:hypothetical protein